MDADTVTVINDATGESRQRRLVSGPELKLSLTTALLMGSALSGTPRKGLERMRAGIAADILASFHRSGYSVLGNLPDIRPMPRTYMGVDLDKLDDGRS
jgi:hypothetical protein